MFESLFPEHIQKLQDEINDKQEELLKARKALPPTKVKDYPLFDRDGNTTQLSTLFGDKDELLVIHNMGQSCTYCTMWADVFSGSSEIISDRTPWIITSPDAPDKMKAFAESRNWKSAMYSYHQTDFAFDLGFEVRDGEKNAYWPGVSTFKKVDGEIFRVSYDVFGPGDRYNPVWHLFDLLPEGPNGWQPKYSY